VKISSHPVMQLVEPKKIEHQHAGYNRMH